MLGTGKVLLRNVICSNNVEGAGVLIGNNESPLAANVEAEMIRAEHNYLSGVIVQGSATARLTGTAAASNGQSGILCRDQVQSGCLDGRHARSGVVQASVTLIRSSAHGNQLYGIAVQGILGTIMH